MGLGGGKEEGYSMGEVIVKVFGCYAQVRINE
jgi:hypothetical protein